MPVRRVNFRRAREIYDEKYDEIFNTKNSKIHFALYGDDENDGVVDGAGEKWKNISFMDALITIAVDQVPEGHRINRRSFDQFKCTKYSILMSYNYNHYPSNNIIRVDDLEIYDMPLHYQSARGFLNYFLPEYRGDIERTRRKMSRLFYFQLKALVPNLYIDDRLSIADKLDNVIAEVDRINLFQSAIIKVIRISLLYNGNDFIFRHWEIIEELVDSSENKTSKSIEDSTPEDFKYNGRTSKRSKVNRYIEMELEDENNHKKTKKSKKSSQSKRSLSLENDDVNKKQKIYDDDNDDLDMIKLFDGFDPLLSLCNNEGDVQPIENDQILVGHSFASIENGIDTALLIENDHTHWDTINHLTYQVTVSDVEKDQSVDSNRQDNFISINENLLIYTDELDEDFIQVLNALTIDDSVSDSKEFTDFITPYYNDGTNFYNHIVRYHIESFHC